MKTLFDAIDLGGLKLKNRLVRSASFEQNGADENGRIQPVLTEIYTALAEGGVGAIISGQQGVGATGGYVSPTMVRIQDESYVPRYSEAVNAAHANGCPVVVQLNHAGPKGIPAAGQDKTLAPSDIEFKPGSFSRGMTKDEIAEVVRDFGTAAAKCKQAGADGVQLHAAHGYLISCFLSPYTNKRTDEYGGPIENRARILYEAYDAVRAAVGPDYPVWIKLNATDLTDPGITPEEFTALCKELEKQGINAIEVSGGLGVSPAASSVQPVKTAGEGYFSRQALALANQVSVPVICVAGHRNPAAMQTLLNEGNIAALSLCRPFIRQPDLANLWKAGSTANAECISCGRCFDPTIPFGCPVKAGA